MGGVLAGLLMVILALGEATSAEAPAPASPQRRHVIEILGFQFHPYHTAASPGDTVVWVNRDVAPHTATAREAEWNSPELAEGDSWQMIVREHGLQNYYCEFHPHMEGILEVRSMPER